MWDLIVSVPDHCLSFYSERERNNSANVSVFDKWATMAYNSATVTARLNEHFSPRMGTAIS